MDDPVRAVGGLAAAEALQDAVRADYVFGSGRGGNGGRSYSPVEANPESAAKDAGARYQLSWRSRLLGPA